MRFLDLLGLVFGESIFLLAAFTFSRFSFIEDFWSLLISLSFIFAHNWAGSSPILLSRAGFCLNGFIGHCVFTWNSPSAFSSVSPSISPSYQEIPSVQKWQASLSDMTHLALCSLPAEVFFSFSPSQQHDSAMLPLTLVPPMHFFTNRECFESAAGFLMDPRINSEEPAPLSHMIQHPLIKATLCCVTKSQLHHAPSDWSALTVVDGI